MNMCELYRIPRWSHFMMDWRMMAVVSLLAMGLFGCESNAEPGPGENSERGDDFSGTEDTQYQRIEVERVSGDLDHPWAVAFLPDGRYLVTERPGTLQLIDDGEHTEVGGVPEVRAQGQGGLLDVVIHPDFVENQWVYLTYSKQESSGSDTATALARGRLDGGELVEVEELFVQDRYSSAGRHYGSRLAWMPDGTLLMSIGDRGTDPPRSQDLGDHAGTLLRLNDDGSVPADNPFVDDPDALDEIYSYGHRNIQGLVVTDDGTIWATEHGPRGGDELNRVEAGLNYGWPTVTLGLDYGSQDEFPHSQARRMEGMEDPFFEFSPTLAPSGLALVTTDQFDRWEGNLLAGGLRARRIHRVVFDDREVLHQEELLLHKIGRIRDVRQGPDGAIYVVSDESDGGLYRVTPG